MSFSNAWPSACARASATWTRSRASAATSSECVPDLKQPETATTLVSRLLEIVSHPMDYNGQQIVSGVSIEVALSATDAATTPMV